MSNTVVTASLKELLSRAERLEQKGELGQAGMLFERAGDVDRAIQCYRKSGNVDRAAELLEKTGRAADAGALLMSAGAHLHAAALYEKYRQYAKAAAALLRANQRERAAAMYEKAEAFEDAAKIYASLGNYRRAIQLYGHIGAADKAAELERLAAEGEATEQVLELDPSMALAADQYLDSKQVVDAVVAHLKAGRVEDAVHLYENCAEDIGYNVLAAVAGDRATERRAADMFTAARDFAKAGQVFENLEDFASAGRMYELADDAYMAGEMYVRAGNQAKAAEMLERAGNYKQAAELYLHVKNFEKAAENFERAMNTFLAGKLYFRINRLNKSLQLLQKVQRGEREYFEACVMIGEILSQNGYLDLAIKKYLEVVQSAEMSAQTLPVYYRLARALEAKGEHAQALNLYQRIVLVQMDYEDVGERIRALSGRAKAEPAPRAQPERPSQVRSAVLQPLPKNTPAPEDARTGMMDGSDLEKLFELGKKSAQEEKDGKRDRQLVSMMGGFEFLKKTPLFQDLSLEEMKALYNACEVRTFKPKEVLIEQDQSGSALFVLRKGTAVVVKVTEDGENVIARLSPGSLAGEMALVDDAPTSARVRADSEVEAFCITRDRFEKLLGANEKTALKLYRFFVRMLAKRLRSTSDTLAAAQAR